MAAFPFQSLRETLEESDTIRKRPVTRLEYKHQYRRRFLTSPYFVYKIDHFTDVCSVTWPLNGSEAVGDLVLIQISALVV